MSANTEQRKLAAIMFTDMVGYSALGIHDVCQAADVPVWIGGMFETGIGRAFNIALPSLPNFTLPADMSPPLMYFAEDLVDPGSVVEDGWVDVPGEIGLAIR